MDDGVVIWGGMPLVTEAPSPAGAHPRRAVCMRYLCAGAQGAECSTTILWSLRWYLDGAVVHFMKKDSVFNSERRTWSAGDAPWRRLFGYERT